MRGDPAAAFGAVGGSHHPTGPRTNSWDRTRRPAPELENHVAQAGYRHSTPSSRSPSGAASCSSRERSTAARGRRGTTRPLGAELKENIKRQWWRIAGAGPRGRRRPRLRRHPPRQVWGRRPGARRKRLLRPLVECLLLPQGAIAPIISRRSSGRRAVRRRTACRTSPPAPRLRHRGQWTDPQEFSGLLKTHRPVASEEGMRTHLRPETAWGIFVNFNNVLTTARKKRSASPRSATASATRSPRNFIFRTREFEQMEMEFFVEPGYATRSGIEYWIEHAGAGTHDLGDRIRRTCASTSIRRRAGALLEGTDRHRVTEFRRFQAPWSELEGVANRTDYDLVDALKRIGTDLVYFDQVQRQSAFTPVRDRARS
ncbi:MAG: hypothetical protein WKG07_06480 [Hymenobacter sp.]